MLKISLELYCDKIISLVVFFYSLQILRKLKTNFNEYIYIYIIHLQNNANIRFS